MAEELPANKPRTMEGTKLSDLPQHLLAKILLYIEIYSSEESVHVNVCMRTVA